MFATLREKFGGLDIFVSNARPDIDHFYQPVIDIPLENWQPAFDSQARALLVAAREAIKLMPDTYFQGEVAYRFPLGGDQQFEGSVLHGHAALNRVLWCCGNDIKVIGSAELNCWSIEGGTLTIS